eukprot:GCRY01002006.1.p1 GENE.GCRY01002006.1~~GCRY01002006.1.p1  ORF type:complete len:511 (+),score=145.03 GCRY01002006.1:162-1694(+)
MPPKKAAKKVTPSVKTKSIDTLFKESSKKNESKRADENLSENLENVSNPQICNENGAGFEEEPKTKKAKATRSKAKPKTSSITKKKAVKGEDMEVEESDFVDSSETASFAVTFSPESIETLAKENPDLPWTTGILDINESLPLELKTTCHHQGSVYRLAFSPDGYMMASVSVLGSVRVWETETWTCLSEMWDLNEKNIEQFYCCAFAPNGKYIFAAGKTANRKRWEFDENDNECIPGAVKVFDLLTGEVVDSIPGHKEEVTFLLPHIFKGEHYLITCSQDGCMRKVKMSKDWKKHQKVGPEVKVDFMDGLTCMSFAAAAVPRTGGQDLLCACDETVKIFNFEAEMLVQKFDDLFTSYCDSAVFVPALSTADGKEHIFIARGVEAMQPENTSEMVRPNRVCVCRLHMPDHEGGSFACEVVHELQHEKYLANSWLCGLGVTPYVAVCPTMYGTFCVFNIHSGDLVATLGDHKERVEVRHAIFHPSKPILCTCSDDGSICVYEQKTSKSTKRR